MSFDLALSFSRCAEQHPSLLPHAAAVCQAAAALLLAAAWQVSFLVVCVAITLRAVPQLNATTRSAAWTAVLLVSLALPFAPLLTAGHLTGVHPAPPIQLIHPIHLDSRWSFALAGSWILLSLLRAVSLARSAVLLHQLARHATPLLAHELVLAPEICRASRHPTICISDQVSCPSVLGFCSPRILIPSHLYNTLAPSELQQIVLHESEHLRRYDDWRNLGQKVALVLFPLNPGLLWVERRLCREREMACDEHVLRITSAPKSYASCLVHLAEQSRLGSRLSLELGAWAGRSELARRVHQILDWQRQSISRPQAIAFSLLLGAGLASSTVALSKAPPLFSFAAPPSTASPVAGYLMVAEPPRSFERSVHPPRLSLVSTSVPLMHPAQRSIPPDKRALHRKPPRRDRVAPSAPSVLLSSSSASRGPIVSPAMVTTSLTESGALPSSMLLLEADAPSTRVQPRLVWTVVTSTGSAPETSTYAAVPTGSGWLIFQL